jgi:hypothetical protein
MLALIVQWLGHLVVAEKTWVRFPLGAHNNATDSIGSIHQEQTYKPPKIFQRITLWRNCYTGYAIGENELDTPDLHIQHIQPDKSYLQISA